MQKYNTDRFFGKDLTNIVPYSQEQQQRQSGKFQQNKKKLSFINPKTALNNEQYDDQNKDIYFNTKRTQESQVVSIENRRSYSDMLNLDSVEYELNRIEVEDKKIPQNVSAYSKQIFAYLLQQEKKYAINSLYMVKQEFVNEKMRSILIDWIIEVHQNFKMVPETLFMTVNLVDRYLEKNTRITVDQFQLVGIAALFISSKYEEIYPPDLRKFAEVTDQTYTKKEILDMESKILLALDFNLTVPSSLVFLERYIRIQQLEKKPAMLAKYLLELVICDNQFVKYLPSNIAGAAIYLSNKVFMKQNCWSEVMTLDSGYTEKQIRECARELCQLLLKHNSTERQAARKKYSSSKYLEISKINISYQEDVDSIVNL